MEFVTAQRTTYHWAVCQGHCCWGTLTAKLLAKYKPTGKSNVPNLVTFPGPWHHACIDLLILYLSVIGIKHLKAGTFKVAYFNWYSSYPMEIHRPIEAERDLESFHFESDKFLRYNKFSGGGKSCQFCREALLQTVQLERVSTHIMWWISVWAKQQKEQDEWKDEGDGTQTSSDMAISLINIMHKKKEGKNEQERL